MNSRPPTDPEFAAILASDATADGRFIYGVRSTKICCLPSCRSRAPRRANVAVFDDLAAAMAAGFRPCKRCRPDAAPAPDRRLERARALIDACLADGRPVPALTDLGRAAHASPAHLQRLFAAAYGLSPRAYAEARRVELLKHTLRKEPDVTDAIYAAGFGASSRVYEKAGRWLGMTPADYRRGGEGLDLRVSVRSSPLGLMLVAVSPRGIAALLLGDSEAALLRELRAEFPNAGIVMDARAGADAAAAFRLVLRGEPLPASLPLDLRGTPFQIRVWQALQAIPAGETRSYAEIARAIGHPKAVRAVGSACANNILGVLVPCHRAKRSDGGLGGYRWGLKRKERLLATEARAAEGD